MTNDGVCPKCYGTARIPATPDQARWKVATYNETSNTVACTNCGGQTMSLKGTGRVALRTDGTPCMHEWASRNVGRCLTQYTCKHCPTTFQIDSGD